MKQNFIELITEVDNNGEVKDKKVYVTPGFIPFSKLIEASKELESTEDKSEMEGLEEMLKVVCSLYNNQFTTQELMDGLDSREAIDILKEQIEYISTGKVSEANQAKLKELNK
ncbi:hypothetical protein [Staphylococcus sp. GDK8D68P]|uniref:phage tail assembly chaperone G n=1 Tax=Staphylococcus sp. GDK8D68P TaxID=2804092 RepID=UPI001AEC4756|nr:hypothetical protein [Staphylococcus sp. GDK8D68P]